MKHFSKIAAVAAVLASIDIPAAAAQTLEEAFSPHWVEYRDDRLSVMFDQIPVVVALQAIRQKTGFQFSLPTSADNKLLNFRLERAPLEPALYALLSNIGFRNFALIYDEGGRPNRAVVLGAQVAEAPAVSADSTHTAEPVAQPLNTEERDRLQEGLERWGELKQAERGRIEERLKTLPPSEEREQLVK